MTTPSDSASEERDGVISRSAAALARDVVRYKREAEEARAALSDAREALEAVRRKLNDTVQPLNVRTTGIEIIVDEALGEKEVSH